MAKPNSNGTGAKMSGFISGLLNEGMSAVNEMFSKGGGNGSSGGTNSADMTPDSFRAMIATGPKNESIRQQIALWESLVTAVAGFDDQISALQNKKATMDKQRAEVQYQIHKAMYDLQQERLAAEAAQEQQSQQVSQMQGQQAPQQMWQRGGYPGQGIPQQAWGPQGYPGQAPQQYQGYPGQQAQAWGPGPQGYPGQMPQQYQGYPDTQGQEYPGQAPRGQMPQQEWNQPQSQPQGYQQQSAPGWQINEAPAPTQPLPGFSSLNSQEYADAHQFGDYMGPTAREAVSKGNPHGGAPDLPSIDPATVIQGASFDDLPPLEESAGGYVQYGTADDISAEDMLDDESDLPVGGVLN